MSARQQSHITSFNRVLIYALTIGGLLMDGPQIADLPCALALCIWLWLPYCSRLVTQLLKRIDGTRSTSVSYFTHNFVA